MSEWDRILSLPVLNDYPNTTAVIDLMTAELASERGQMRLLPDQAQALYQALHGDTLLGMITVGGGKTLTCLLLPTVLECDSAIILTKPSLTTQFEHDWRNVYAPHWQIIKNTEVWSYSRVSRGLPDGTDFYDYLVEKRPSIIVADEAHAIAGDSARAEKIQEYIVNYPETLFAAVSGTIMVRRVQDMEALSRISLRDNSPIPMEYPILERLGRVINARPYPHPDKKDFARMAEIYLGSGKTEIKPRSRARRRSKGTGGLRQEIREAFQERLISTPGVYASSTIDIPVELEMVARDTPPVNAQVEEAKTRLKDLWLTPDQEEVDYYFEFARLERNLSSGFYYRWDWGEEDKTLEDEAWLLRRAKWHALLRQLMKYAPPNANTPATFIEYKGKDLYSFKAYLDWLEVKDLWKPHPPVETVWLDTSHVEDCAQWLKEQDVPSIAFTSSRAFEEKIEEFGAHVMVPDFSTRIPRIATPIRKNMDGKNLQYYQRILLCEPISNGKWLEQAIGRIHRTGQTSDKVQVHYYACNPWKSDLEKAKADALCIYENTGNPQRLLQAVWS